MFSPRPVPAGDKNNIPEAGFGVEGKDHAARSHVGADHLHDTDRKRNLEMIKILVDPVRYCPVGEQGGKTFTAGFPEAHYIH